MSTHVRWNECPFCVNAQCSSVSPVTQCMIFGCSVFGREGGTYPPCWLFTSSTWVRVPPKETAAPLLSVLVVASCTTFVTCSHGTDNVQAMRYTGGITSEQFNNIVHLRKKLHSGKRYHVDGFAVMLLSATTCQPAADRPVSQTEIYLYFRRSTSGERGSMDILLFRRRNKLTAVGRGIPIFSCKPVPQTGYPSAASALKCYLCLRPTALSHNRTAFAV